MPNTLLRIAVALLTFGLGVTATTFWIAYRTPEVQSLEVGPSKYIACTKRSARPYLDELPPPPPLPLQPHAPVSGGILNGKAISKPRPVYPPVALAAGASGTVNVQIVVDESGEVISAKAISGHTLLQDAAVEAAHRARFSPTLLSGQPVKVSGMLSYNFVVQ